MSCPHSSLTQAFAPPADSSDTTTSADLISLQHRLSTLAAAHANCDSSITAHKNQIGKLLEQIQDLSDSSGGEIIRLERKLEEAEREWRWAKEGREKAESKLGLARQEIEGLRMKVKRME
jgi:mitotic spindle assembly checkpoint protein MAD1